MKTRKQILMLLLVMLAGIPTLSAQTKKEKKEQKKEAVRQLIVSEDYKIDVNTAMPMRGRSIPLTSQYSLQIRNDSVFSYLRTCLQRSLRRRKRADIQRSPQRIHDGYG